MVTLCVVAGDVLSSEFNPTFLYLGSFLQDIHLVREVQL